MYRAFFSPLDRIPRYVISCKGQNPPPSYLLIQRQEQNNFSLLIPEKAVCLMRKNPSAREQLEEKYKKQRRDAQKSRFRRRLPGMLLAAVLMLLVCGIVWLTVTAKKPRLPDMPVCVCVLDVGQGDAILVRSQGHAALIDGGEVTEGNRLVQLLRDAGVRRLDCVINSHPHSDHLGGLQSVLDQMPVAQIYFPDIPQALLPTTAGYLHFLETAAQKQIPTAFPACGQTVTVGAAELTFLCTDNSAFDNLNDCSLGVCVRCGDFRFLAAGDAEEAAERAFVAAGLIEPVTVLKISHHGSKTSSTAELLSAAAPQYSCISAGAGNDYGHPAAQTLQALAERKIAVYRTDLDGTICIATDGSSAQITVHALE